MSEWQDQLIQEHLEHNKKQWKEDLDYFAKRLNKLIGRYIEVTSSVVEYKGVRFTLHKNGYWYTITAEIPCVKCGGVFEHHRIEEPHDLGKLFWHYRNHVCFGKEE